MAESMATILTTIGTVVTSVIDWAGEFVTEIAAQPLYLLPLCLGFTLFGVHILKSLMGR